MIPSLAMLTAVLVAAADPSPAEPATAVDPTPVAAPAPSAVDEVAVTAQRTIVGDLQKGVVNYRPEFFTPVRPGTAMDMVAWLPGFIFEDTRDMRGIEGSTGNVLIDGKPPTSKTDTLQSVLRRIPASQVERVDIIVGGAPGIDMHGRNVIANVILKAGANIRRQLTAATYVNSHGRVSPTAQATTSEKRDGKVIEGSLEVGRNYAIGPNWGYGSLVHTDPSGAVQYAADSTYVAGKYGVAGSGTYEQPFAGGRLRVNGLARYYPGVYERLDRLRPGPDVYSFREDSAYKQGELGLRFERAFGRTTLETTLLERLTKYDWTDDFRQPPAPLVSGGGQDIGETALRALLRFKRDDRLTVEGFAEAALNSVDTVNQTTVGESPLRCPAPIPMWANEEARPGSPCPGSPAPSSVSTGCSSSRPPV